MTTHSAPSTHPEATIEADAEVPAIRITREFAATPAQVFRAHTDPDLFVQWIGPERVTTHLDVWDPRAGGSFRYHSVDEDGAEYAFRGCFHTVREDRIVQTFTWEGLPDAVGLETLTLVDLGDGRTRLEAFSLCDSFAARDGWLSSGMEVGVNEGYGALDRMLVDGLL